MPSMTTEQSIAIYDILMKSCGANAAERDEFIRKMTGQHPPKIWYFNGLLGDGGKLLVHEMRVSCNLEDCSEQQLAILSSVNQQLKWQAPLMTDFIIRAPRPKSTLIRYLSGINKKVDEAIAQAEIEIQPGDSWWHIYDELISKGLNEEAALAQQHAVPTVDLVAWLQAELAAARAAIVRRES